MSPALANIYGDKLIEEALEKSTGYVVGGERIRTIKYADQAILASSEEELRTMLQKITDVGQRYRMRINVKKSDVMEIFKKKVKHVIDLDKARASCIY